MRVFGDHLEVNPENPGLAKELVPRGVTWWKQEWNDGEEWWFNDGDGEEWSMIV